MTQVILITSPIIKKITYKRPSISRIRRRKSTQVFCLPSTCLAFCLPTHVCWLASTYDECVDFGRSQSWRKFFTVWPPSQFGRSRSQVICIIVKFSTFATCVNLRADLRICLATHRKLASTCIDLRVRLATHCKSGFAKLRQLASTCKSVWPGLKSSLEFEIYVIYLPRD